MPKLPFTPSDDSTQPLTAYANGVPHQRLHWQTFDDKKLKVYLRRDDIASDHYPGNKWYKLFYNLQTMINKGHHTVVSFGGAYSNHIHALAALGQQYDINTVGIIRGYPPLSDALSPTLQDAKAWGMCLRFLGYGDYRNKDLRQYQEWLDAEYGEYYCLPEGGDNLLGAQGCQAIGASVNRYCQQTLGVNDYTLCAAMGTGTTFAGIVSSLPTTVSCLGFSSLKGEDTLSAHIAQRLLELNSSHSNWQVLNEYHHGGYAKTTPELLRFMLAMESANDLLLEPVYSAKMLWGIDQLAQADYWPEGSTIVAIHGGGLQGRRGFFKE
ncbi:1-aminocyclopropane-1-carboxylate deaminase/D-cysteine desulfhydrase [Eionea flava]